MRVAALLFLVSLVVSACGTSRDDCRRLAETACEHFVSCGQEGEETRDRCLAEEEERCLSESCGEGLRPVSGSVAECLEEMERASCEEFVFGQTCTLMQCVADAGDTDSTDRYFAHFDPLDLPPCNEGERPDIGGLVEVRVFTHAGDGVDEDDVLDCTRGLQRFYQPYDLWFYAEGGAEEIDLPAVVDAPIGDMVYALEDAGIPLDREPTAEELDRAAEALAGVVFRPLRAFLDEHGHDTDHVNFGVVPRIAGEEAASWLFPNGAPVGIGFSPKLLERLPEDDEEGRLYRRIGLPDEFTPTLFVAPPSFRDTGLACDVVAAHELGHALGLVHDDASGNLMRAGGGTSCLPDLRQAQTDAMAPIRLLAVAFPVARVMSLPEILRTIRANTPRLLAHLRATR